MIKTRFKVTVIVIFALIVLAVLKHFLPGISEAMLGMAVVTGLGYLWNETKRPSV